MAEIPVQRRSGGGVPTWLFVVGAVVVVGAFMAWLALTAEPTTVQVVEASPADTLAQTANAVPAISVQEFAGNGKQYIGREVRLTGVTVDSRLGDQAFWLRMPNQGLYLVRSTKAGTAGTGIASGMTVNVAGPVVAMGDSVVRAWIDAGAITQDQEMEARYATSYIDAWWVQVAQGGAQQQAAPAATTSRGDTARAAAQ